MTFMKWWPRDARPRTAEEAEEANAEAAEGMLARLAEQERNHDPIDWRNRRLFDSSGTVSIDWAASDKLIAELLQVKP